MVSDRAQVGWSTHGHSAVDVNIYSSGGPGTDALRANVENTDVGRFLRDYLAVDVADVTRELNEKRKANAANAAEAAAALKLDSAAPLSPLTDLHRQNLSRHRTCHGITT